MSLVKLLHLSCKNYEITILGNETLGKRQKLCYLGWKVVQVKILTPAEPYLRPLT